MVLNLRPLYGIFGVDWCNFALIMNSADTMGNGGAEALIAKGAEAGTGSGAVGTRRSEVPSATSLSVAAAIQQVLPDASQKMPDRGPVVVKTVPRGGRKRNSEPPVAIVAANTTGPIAGTLGGESLSGDGVGSAGGGDGRNKPSSGEHKLEIIHPSQELLDVVDELKETGHANITAVSLFDHRGAQEKFRREYWDKDFQDDIARIQQDERTRNANDPESWYGLGKYRGGRIMIENAALVTGFDTVFDMLFDENGLDNAILEIGPGFGDVIRGAQKAKEKMTEHAGQIRSLNEKMGNGQKTISVNKLQTEIRQRARNVDLNAVDPHLLAIDLVQKFCRNLQRFNIAAFPGDICDDIENLIGKHKLESGQDVELMLNSIKVFFLCFVGDRVKDLNAAAANMSRLAKPGKGKKRPRFMMVSGFPYSAISDSDSKSENIPAVKFWDPAQDMRRNWTGNPKDPNDPKARKRSVVNAVLDMARAGLVVDRIAIQPTYEAYSAHCIIENAGDLRKKYTLDYLLERYEDTDYEPLIHDVFAGKVPDEKRIALPQIYKNVYMLGGYVRPLEGENEIDSEEVGETE